MLVGQKLSTKAYSSAPQESSLRGDPNLKNLSAGGKNPLGDKSVGEFANEMVDPNYVDPKKVQRERKTDLDKDAFFKLMLTQMKFQDPMNPMQSHEMAAQLAQFTQLEQTQNINSNIEGLRKTQEPAIGYEALNFIGKTISADSSKLSRGASDKNHDIRFRMMKDADDVKIMIRDNTGAVVRTLNAGQRKKGENVLSWNGLTDQGFKAREGNYAVIFEAQDMDGKKIGIETNISGKISGVNFTNSGPVLLIGDQSVYLSDVKKIEDLSLKDEVKAQDKETDKSKPSPSAEQLAPAVNPALSAIAPKGAKGG